MLVKHKVQEILKWLTIQKYEYTSFLFCIPFIRTHCSYPQRLHKSVANRIDKLNSAWEQQQFKSLCLIKKIESLFQNTQIWVQDPSKFDAVSINARFLFPSQNIFPSSLSSQMKKGTVHVPNPSHLCQWVSSACTLCLTVSLLNSCSAWIYYQIGFDNDCYLILCNTQMQLFPDQRTV